ncbi:MAG: TIR domain-containing protein [Opitutaceae bacterium]|nr:TIR domain-containing protein [Opitutaceae bacterium]
MSHVFISYARATAKQAQQVAAVLRSQGHEVWLDDAIPAHRPYAEVIEERLREAKAVVVIWSEDAAKSEWVRSEADRARVARKLVQLTVDGAALPMPFDQIQCAHLVDWQGDRTAAGWKQVAASVATLLGDSIPAREPAQPLPIPPGSVTPDIYTVAVAPFTDPAGAIASDDFAEGLFVEITMALSRFPVLQVVDSAPTARYLLGANIQRSGPRVRINFQLRDTERGERIWVERFDRVLEDPFAVQDDVAGVVVSSVETAILGHETRRIAGKPVTSLSPHQLWLRSRETIRRAGLAQIDEIEALSEAAVALNPTYGRGLAFLATALGFRLAFAGPNADVAALRARFTDTVNRAMVVETDDAEVLVFVAEALLLAEADLVVARALVDRAVNMNPALSVGWDVSGNIRMQSGEYEVALAHYERCLRLDPKSPWRTYVWPSMAGCLVAMGRFDEAIVLAKQGLQIGPNNPWAAASLIAALAHSGRVAEARVALAQFDPRQAGVLRSSHFGPKLSRFIDEALRMTEAQKQE